MRCNSLGSKLRTSLFAVAILVPSLAEVNHFSRLSGNLRADGNPVPPLPPRTGVTLVADGNPIPPLPPRTEATLVADGNPIPPLPPRGGVMFVAV